MNAMLWTKSAYSCMIMDIFLRVRNAIHIFELQKINQIVLVVLNEINHQLLKH